MPMENNYPYAPDFRPILQVGQTARLIRGNPENFVDVEVTGVFPLGVHVHDFGTMTTSSLNQDCTHLDMDNGEMAQIRYIPRGRFRVHLQNPNGVDIYRTQGSAKGDQTAGWFIDNVSGDPDEIHQVRSAMFALSEFLVYEDETPRFDLYGLAPAAQIEMYVHFYGFGFSLRKADKTPPVTIWTSGRPRGQELGT